MGLQMMSDLARDVGGSLTVGSVAERRDRGPDGGRDPVNAERATIRVAIADDHKVVRVGLEQLLGTFDDVEPVGAASGGAEAVALCETERPDVLLLDLSMPEVDGIEVTRRLREAAVPTHVVVFTSFSDRERIVQALDAGAVGYLLKDAEPDEIHGAIQAAARGESPLAPRAAAELLAERRARPTEVELTAREQEVLGLVVEGLANKQIARRMGISEKTVKGHLTNLFQRIGVSDRTQAALWAERNGTLPRIARGTRSGPVPGRSRDGSPVGGGHARVQDALMQRLTRHRARAIAAALCVTLLAAAPAVAGGGSGEDTRGDCSGGPGRWRLEVDRRENGRLRVRFRVDHVPAGGSWQVFLSDNGTRIFSGTKRADGGQFRVTELTANRAGSDRIAASAVASASGSTCGGSLTF